MTINLGRFLSFPDCPDVSYGRECNYFASGAMPGSGRVSKEKKQMETTRKTGVCRLCLVAPHWAFCMVIL